MSLYHNGSLNCVVCTTCGFGCCRGSRPASWAGAWTAGRPSPCPCSRRGWGSRAGRTDIGCPGNAPSAGNQSAFQRAAGASHWIWNRHCRWILFTWHWDLSMIVWNFWHWGKNYWPYYEKSRIIVKSQYIDIGGNQDIDIGIVFSQPWHWLRQFWN